MKDIETNVKVKPKVTGLKGLKSEIRKSLNGDKFKANVGVKVTGEAKLAKLAREMEKVRRLANEPIKFSVDAGNSKFDEQVAKARKGIDDLNKSYTKGAGLGLRKQVEEARRNMEQTYAAMRKNNLDATKANNDRVAQVYKESAAQNKAQLQKDIAEYRRLSEDAGIGRKDINKQIRRSTTPSIKAETAQRLAETRREISAAKRDWQDYGRIMKEAYSAEQKMAKGTAGRNETKALRERAAALRSEAEAIKLIPEYQEKANRAERAQQRNLSMINAKRLDGAYASNARRTRTRGGIIPTMDIGGALMTGAMAIAGIVEQYNAVDKAITKVTKVVPDSQRAVNRWRKNIYKDAAEVGKSAPEFASAVEQWATAGYNLKQSNRLAKQSVMASFVGEVPVNDMVKYMSVPMKAFQKEGIKSTDIINAMNEVSNKHAIEMDDLGQAYQKASSTVGATGTKFSQLTGIITAAQEGTRAGGEAIGTAYKTIGSRIAKMGTGLTKQDQTRAAFFKGLGVNLTDTNGKLKSTWDVMDQLGKKWDTLSEKDKNTAAQYAAGANHANIFQATMDNWKTARQAMREAEDQQGLGSDGSAYQEMAKQKQSVEFQLKGLQDMWGQFVENITGGRKGISDMLNVVSFLGNGLTKLSANPFLSSAVRWGTVAAGMVMARKAMVSLAGGLGSVISQGKKEDSVLERLTGISSKTQKMKDSGKELKNAWNDLLGKSKSSKKLPGEALDEMSPKSPKKGSDVNGIIIPANISDSTQKIKENTTAKRKNAEVDAKLSKGARKVGDLYTTQGAAIEIATDKAKSHGEVMTKVSKGWGVLKAGAGVLSAGLGYVGLALDAVTIAGMAMNAMGIHPIKALQKVMDPLSESAKKTDKYFGRIGDSVAKASNSINSNRLATGQTSSDLKQLKNISDSLGSLDQKDGKYVGDNFEKIKNNLNAIAKHNGLDFKIRDADSVDVVNKKVQTLHGLVESVKQQDISSLIDNASKSASAFNKVMSSDGIKRAAESTKDYRDYMDDIDKKSRSMLNRRPGESAKQYRQRRKNEYLDDISQPGEANEKFWNSSQGRRNLKIARQAQKNRVKVIDAMADNLYDGTISTANVKAMNSEGQGYAALGVIKNLKSLNGSNDTKQINDTKQQLSDILSALGASQSSIKSIQKAASSSKYSSGDLLKGLLSSPIDKQTVAAWAGIGPKYQSQHPNDWQRTTVADQRKLDSFRNKHQDANVTGLVDPETNNVNWDNLATFNNKVTYGKGKGRLGAVGIKGPMEANQILAATNGLDYAPLDVLNNIRQGKASPTQIAAVTNNQHRGKSSGKDIVRAIAQSSTSKNNLTPSAIAGLQQLADEGLLSQKQVDDAVHYQSKNYDRKGNAKTKSAARDALGPGKTNADTFTDKTKGLSRKDRQQLAKEYAKNGKLSKQAYNDLRENGDIKGLPKYDRVRPKPKPKQAPKTAAEMEKNIGKGKVTSDQLKAMQNKLKNDKERQKLAMDLKSRNQVKDGPLKKFKDWLFPHADASTRRGTNANDLGRQPQSQKYKFPNIKGFNPFKGLKMPNLSKLNPFKGLKMPKLNMPKGLTSNPFKNWKMPKSVSSPLKNLKLPKNMTNPFKNWKMPKGIDNMFKGSKNPFKGLQSSWNKLFGKGSGKNNKVKVDVDTKGAEKKVKNLGKSSGKSKAKIKVDVDTKGAERKIKTLGKSKNAKAKIKVDADTKGVQSKLKNIGKNSKAKVKVNADTKSAESKVKNIGKNAKAKVKVDADTGNAKSKINSLKSSLRGLNSGKHSIHVSVAVSGEGKVKALKSAISGLSNKSVSINASVSGDGKVKSLKSAIASVSNKSVTVSASVSGTGKVRQLKSAIDGVRSKHVSVTAKVSGTGEVRALASAIASVRSKSVTVSATKIETTIKKTKSGSVGITPENVSQPANPLRSMSVVAGNPQLAGMIGTSAQSMGLASDVNSAMNGQKVTDYSDSTQKVSEDYWRYMGNELYTGLPLDEQVNKLEGAVTQADDNMDKLIDLARQRIDLDNKQIAYQKTMQNAYQQQITDMINELHKYGFQNNGNQITNLNHAKDITGDNASKVDDLLSKYQSAYQNFSQATQKIQELQTDIWQQGKNQDDYRNTKDQKMVEKLQRELELLNTSIDNQKNILDRENDSLTDSDYRMKLKNSSDQIYSKSDAIQQLLAEFNKLSLTNFVGTKDADNAKNLADSLSSIKDSIMENLDAIDELKTSIRDIKINALIDNVDKITDNLSNSVDRLKNNVTNLQDGLLSGTTYSDLVSSDLDVVNLNQKGAYEKGVNDKIQLERELDNVLDQFAKKNVDRTAQVANEQLQIESQKYDQMLSMATSYARGTRWESSKIQSNYNATTESDQIEVSGITHNQEYVKASIEYQKQLNDLKARYNEQMANADSAETKQLINQRLVYEQLMLQEKVYGTMIETDKQAIAELRKQFNDPDMNSEQLKTISDKITEYENNIMDAQNNIKEAVKSRYDYEKTLLDKEIDDYQRLSDTMSNLVTIADALHLNGETQASIINQQYEATYLQYNNYLDILARLREERSKFEKGSYEWNQLNSMIQEYQPSLESIVTSLLEVNKNEFEQKLSSVQEYFEKNINEGKTADQAKFDQDVWYNPVQKELRLEEMRLKIVELEDKTVEKRIAALDAQERMSKAEADYVDKQLDLALAQQKLNNTINKKDVRYLEKDENGKFNWTYIADQDQVDAARQEVNKAKQAIEDAKVSNRNDYIEKMEQVASKIQDGSINQEEAKKRFEELNNSYKFVLKDIPGFDVTKGEDILQAFNEYEQRNKDILNDYRRNDNISNKAGYKEIIDGFGEQFKMVSKDLGEIFGKQLHDALSLPNGIRNAYGNGTDNSLTINGDLKVELPDVTNVDEFAKAIATLPQVARQKATSK